jgi:hypothetical protein
MTIGEDLTEIHDQAGRMADAARHQKCSPITPRASGLV